ncbi:MAG: chemotaxis protein CheW [Succinatimonas sp.]|nr:chemotaxis protein CheW [Succinatimonas sp.]
MTHYENEEEDLLAYFEQMLVEGELQGSEHETAQEFQSSEQNLKTFADKTPAEDLNSAEPAFEQDPSCDEKILFCKNGEPQKEETEATEEKNFVEEAETVINTEEPSSDLSWHGQQEQSSHDLKIPSDINENLDSQKEETTESGRKVVAKEPLLQKSSAQAELKTVPSTESHSEQNDQAVFEDHDKEEDLIPQPLPELCTGKQDPLPVKNTPSLQSLLDSLQDDIEIETQDESNDVAVKTVETQLQAETKLENKSLDLSLEKSRDAVLDVKQQTSVAEHTEPQTVVEVLPQTSQIDIGTQDKKTAVKTSAEPKTEVKLKVKTREQTEQQKVVTVEKVEAISSISVQPKIQSEDLATAHNSLINAKKTDDKPQELNWHKLKLPDEFQVLFFLVKGVRFAVPLVNLGGIFETPKLTKIAGRPVWYKGMADVRGTKLSLIDTMRWVKPEDSNEHDYQYMIVLDNSAWALGCDELEGNRVLRGDQIKFREKAGSRPWLAGIVKKEMCALLHVQALTAMFERGMGLCSVSADKAADGRSQN